MEEIIAYTVGAALSVLVVGTVTGLLAFVGKVLRDFLKKRLSQEELKVLLAVARQAVLAVEQTSAGEVAEAKKLQAIRIVQTFLDAYGIKANAKQVSAAIEAAVFAELRRWEELPEPAPEEPEEPRAIDAGV